MGELLDMEGDPDGVAAFAASADIGTEMLTPVGALDPASLSQHGRVDWLIAMERLKAWADAQQQRCLAEIAAHPAPLPSMTEAVSKQWAREEVACALRWSFGTTAARLGNAAELVRRLPDTLDALQTGAISLRHVRVLVDAVVHLSDEVTAAVQARVLPRAGTQTVAEFRRCVKQAVLSLDAAGQEQRHLVAVSERRVEVWPGEDGMSTVTTLVRADDAAAVMAELTATARRVQPGDARTIDQRRADAFVTLITGTCAAAGSAPSTPELAANLAPGSAEAAGRPARPVRPGPAVRVTVALSTLLGLDAQPGELDGYGPIPAVLARRIAGDPTGTWRRLVTDPHGQLLDYGRTVYRPPANLADHVTARDQTCRMVGCSRPAVTCEQDHIIDWAEGGHTSDTNLQAECGRHHHAKHDADWRVTRDPDTGITHWTSPTGRRYSKPPDPLPIDTTRTPNAPADESETATPDTTTPADPHDEAPPF